LVGFTSHLVVLAMTVPPALNFPFLPVSVFALDMFQILSQKK
jgi:hypothetical protein